MEDIDSPETAAWVAAERAFTAEQFAKMPEREAIRSRLKQLWDFPKYALPVKRRRRMFYAKNDGLQNQAVLYVIDAPGAEPRVLLDPNTLSSKGTVVVKDISVSENGELLGYALAAAGSDWVELHVRDVVSGADSPDLVRSVKFSSIAWTLDAKGFFYSRYPEVAQGDTLFGKLSGRQLFYHRLGTEQGADGLIFEIRDHPDWFFNGDVTEDGRYLVISVRPTGKIQNALYYMDLADPLAPRMDGPVVHLLDKFDAEYTVIANSGPVFHVMTTLGAPKGRVVSIDTRNAAPSAWKTPVMEGPDSIEAAVFAGGKFVVATLHDVQSRLSVYGADGASLGPIALPGSGSVSGLSARSSDPEFFYGFSSFLMQPSIMSHNLATGAESVFEQPQAGFDPKRNVEYRIYEYSRPQPPEPFDPSRYETVEIFYPSRDGTKIPLFIIARKGLKLDGSSPTWLYGYGGFNISITPAYAVPAAVWLEMGGIYAQANIRGGGEYGEAWHLAGTKERKQNVFDDFIAAADYLVEKGYTKRDRLFIEGRSNGGLLVGAVLNQRPDLCAVAIPGAGVMDMLRFHTFTVGAPWASDYGSSADPEGFAYLRAYSPLHNVREGTRYPAVLITTGDHDDRVFPAHSFKYAAEMQYAVGSIPGAAPVLVRIDSNAGHGGSTESSPLSKTIDEWADKMGFVAHYMPRGSLTLPSAP
jgi:prolyl oligopeptidase